MEASAEYAKASKITSEVELTKMRAEKENEKERLAQQKVREAREADLERLTQQRYLISIFSFLTRI